MSGTLKEGDDLYKTDGSKERVSQIYTVAGSHRQNVTQLCAGDIGATVKLRSIKTGQTLNAKDCITNTIL